MCLTDQIGNRNITLVGGLNGRGKTTFHDSILIALYGKQALKYIQEKARSYDKLLLDHINKHATDEETYVAVSLCLDDGTVLRIKRSWTAKGKKVEQQIIVEKDGVVDKYLGESWSYYIEEILPFGIARFFFFNNEKITQLADDTSFEQIKSSIKSAIGVSTIEKASGLHRCAHIESSPDIAGGALHCCPLVIPHAYMVELLLSLFHPLLLPSSLQCHNGTPYTIGA